MWTATKWQATWAARRPIRVHFLLTVSNIKCARLITKIFQSFTSDLRTRRKLRWKFEEKYALGWPHTAQRRRVCSKKTNKCILKELSNVVCATGSIWGYIILYSVLRQDLYAAANANERNEIYDIPTTRTTTRTATRATTTRGTTTRATASTNVVVVAVALSA